MKVDRSNPVRILVSSIPTLKCEACGRTGGMQDLARSIFVVQPMPAIEIEIVDVDLSEARKLSKPWRVRDGVLEPVGWLTRAARRLWGWWR